MDTPPTALQQAQEWFSLDRYQAAQQFDVLAWSKQIQKRVAIRYSLSAGGEAKETLDFLMEELIDVPLGDFDQSSPYSNMSEAVANLPYATGPVIPIAFHDLDRLIWLRNEFPENADSAIDDWSRNHEKLNVTDFGHVKVDMNARDDDILLAFKSWLTTYRELVGASVKPSRKNRDAEMQNWFESNVLPYFDLISWNQWKGGILKEDDIVDLLFPNDANRTRDWLRSRMTKVDEVITLENAIALSVA